MLDLGDERQLSYELWQSLSSRAKLPTALRDLLQQHAGDGIMADCQRRYARKVFHSVAIMTLTGARHACYAKDISRMGIGFYSPVNILPKKVLHLWLPHGKILQLRVTRCRRLAAHCYEVGSVYHLV